MFVKFSIGFKYRFGTTPYGCPKGCDELHPPVAAHRATFRIMPNFISKIAFQSTSFIDSGALSPSLCRLAANAIFLFHAPGCHNALCYEPRGEDVHDETAQKFNGRQYKLTSRGDFVIEPGYSSNYTLQKIVLDPGTIPRNHIPDSNCRYFFQQFAISVQCEYCTSPILLRCLQVFKLLPFRVSVLFIHVNWVPGTRCWPNARVRCSANSDNEVLPG